MWMLGHSLAESNQMALEGVSKGRWTKESAGFHSWKYVNIHQDSNISAVQCKHNAYSGVAALAPVLLACREAVWGSWASFLDLADEMVDRVGLGVSPT